MSSAGRFVIDVWIGGYPVWCGLKYEGVEIARFSHKELRDLEYAVTKAMREALLALPEKDRIEV